MPGTDDNDEGLENEEGDGDELDPEGKPEGDEGKPPVDGKPDDKIAKRLSDAQSLAQKETARANQAEAALKKLNAGKGSDAGDDPVTKALMQELREASLDSVFGDFPELKEFGIERSLIDGSTRADIRESATQLVKLIKAVATKAGNKALAEHGVTAEPAGATRQQPQNYVTMPDDEFKKLLDSI